MFALLERPWNTMKNVWHWIFGSKGTQIDHLSRFSADNSTSLGDLEIPSYIDFSKMDERLARTGEAGANKGPLVKALRSIPLRGRVLNNP